MYRINVYKLWWHGNDRDLYVGSTKQPLSKRMAKHRISCKGGIRYKIYEVMRVNGYDFQYVLLDSYEVNNRDEQRKYEQHHIDLLQPNLNEIRAYRSPEVTKRWWKQHRETHKDKIKTEKKQYYNRNKNEINAKCKQYNQSHKEEISKYGKQYHEANKVKIKAYQKTKMECDCGGGYTRVHKSRHLRSQKHIKKMNLYYLGLLPLDFC